MTARNITLTIVCATRNAASTLNVLLDSYRSQRTWETELVVVDACSEDGTRDILNGSDCIDRHLVEQDRSIYEAWNKGVGLANGRFVSFIGADDVIAPGAIEALLRAIREHGDMDLIHGHNILMRKGRVVSLIGRPYRPDTIEKFLPMAHVMSAHRRSWLVENGGFDITFKSSGDYDFLLRMRKTMKVMDCGAILAHMEDDGISRRSIRPIMECFRSRRQHGVGIVRNLIWTFRGLAGFWARQWLRSSTKG